MSKKQARSVGKLVKTPVLLDLKSVTGRPKNPIIADPRHGYNVNPSGFFSGKANLVVLNPVWSMS